MSKSRLSQCQTPVNSVAARVTGKGEHFKGRSESSERLEAPMIFTAPLPIDAEDFAGRIIGHLTIVGYIGQNCNRRNVWQARCVCGYYVRRTSKALRKQGDHLQCEDCKYREQIRIGLIPFDREKRKDNA